MKKWIVLLLFVLIPLVLTGCGRNREVFECYYFVESIKPSNSNVFIELNQLSAYTSYTLTLDTKKSTFQIIGMTTDGDMEEFNGTYTKQGNLLTFSYSDPFHQSLERTFGKQVFEYRENGNELYFYQYRDEVVGDRTLGPITQKFRIK